MQIRSKDERRFLRMTNEKEQPEEEPKEQDTKPDSGDVSVVDKAVEVLQGLQKENDRTEANIKRLEEATAKRMLAGRSGVYTDEKPKELSPKEYADMFMKGELTKEDDRK